MAPCGAPPPMGSAPAGKLERVVTTSSGVKLASDCLASLPAHVLVGGAAAAPSFFAAALEFKPRPNSERVGRVCISHGDGKLTVASAAVIV